MTDEPRSTEELAEPAGGEVRRVRLEYLDGVRGAASFYVMLTHLRLFINPALYGTVGWLLPATNWMQYGGTSVSIFIVLSGYCLMIPVARNSSLEIEGGFWSYLYRRARRILPPYYAALAIALLLMRVFSTRIDEIHTFWSSMKPANPSVIITHLLLIHNLSNDWISRIDAPMWSVATEWQIYFLFPLVLLPIYRRSVAGMLAAALVLGVAPMFLFHRGETAYPWFTLLFGIGMVGAAINFTPTAQFRLVKDRVNWGAVCLISTLAVFAWHTLKARHGDMKWKGDLVEDAITAIATMGLLVACTNSLHRHTAKRPVVLLALESRPLLFLGAISYSLYLMHSPILGVTDILIRALSPSSAVAATLYLVGGVAVAIGLTYLFYFVFERPFTRKLTRGQI